jgi:hypothetical protein
MCYNTKILLILVLRKNLLLALLFLFVLFFLSLSFFAVFVELQYISQEFLF